MKETEHKIRRQAEFMRQHSMTKEQQRKLIEDKFERARTYSEALRKREALFENR